MSNVVLMPEYMYDVKCAKIDINDSDVNGRFYNVLIQWFYDDINYDLFDSEENEKDMCTWLTYDTETKRLYDYTFQRNEKRFKNTLPYEKNPSFMFSEMIIMVILDEPESEKDNRFDSYFKLLLKWMKIDDNMEKLSKEIEKMIIEEIL